MAHLGCTFRRDLTYSRSRGETDPSTSDGAEAATMARDATAMVEETRIVFAI